MTHNSYFFVLGRENKISQKEVEAVLANFGFYLNRGRDKAGPLYYSITILNQEVLDIKFSTKPSFPIGKLINILGGTVKIFGKIDNTSRDNLLAGCISAIEEVSSKVIFGISDYSGILSSRKEILNFGLSIKKELKKIGRQSRFIEGKEDGQLSSAQSFQYRMAGDKAIEIGIFADKDKLSIGRLIAVQNIEEWSRCDYGKPASDPISGMLPPKLARMMVNLALGQIGILNSESGIVNKNRNSQFSIHDSCLVIDPFCGSGNVLLEAMTLGLPVIGCDLSREAVKDTKTNLEWFLGESGIVNQKLWIGDHNSQFCIHDSIFQADATKYDFGQIDRDFVVVTEPHLGKPRKAKLNIEEEKQIIAEISILYLDFLKNLLTAGNRLQAVCLVFPLYELKNGKKLSIFEHCIDKIKEFGYILKYPPLKYGRDYQVVKREIVLLRQQ